MSQFISEDVISNGVAVTSSTLTVVDTDVLVSGSTGIIDAGTDGTIRVFGTVFGTTEGIKMGDDPAVDSGHVVVIEHGGSVMGSNNAVKLSSHDGLIENHGDIFSVFIGISFGGLGTGQSTLVNTGAIRGGTTGIFCGNGTTEDIVITNSGIISGDATGFRAITGSASGDMTVTNTGQMLGDVLLSFGDDIYGGASGIVTGEVKGDIGNDRLTMGKGSEVVFGGFGNDIIAGGAGNDRISGDNGLDRMSGGTGNDVFIFSLAVDGGDRISDFSNKSGNNDHFEFDASGFGGGLVEGTLAGSQFRARADNLAQDANDRFILRTSDDSLWFDVDGKGGQAAQLIADLQNDAVVTARDIILI